MTSGQGHSTDCAKTSGKSIIFWDKNDIIRLSINTGGIIAMNYVLGDERKQIRIESLEDYVEEDSQVRVIDRDKALREWLI